MTEEQIKQKAEEYANKVNAFAEDESVYFAAKAGYVSGAHSRDDEIEHMKNESTAIMDEACALKTELDKLRNPWISGENHPTDVTKDYLLEYEDGSYIVAMWDSSMWMSKDLHPLKDPKKWMYIP